MVFTRKRESTMAKLFGKKQEQPRRVPGGNRVNAQSQTANPQENKTVNPQDNPLSSYQFAAPVRDVYSLPAQRRRTQKRKRVNPKFILLCALAAVLVFTLIFGIVRIAGNKKDQPDTPVQQEQQVEVPKETQEPEKEKKPLLGFLKRDPKEETTEPTEPPTVPPTEPPMEIKQTATISVTGDVLMHMPVIKSGYNSETKKYNFDKIFKYLTKYSSKADYAVANLETTLAGTEDGYKYSGYPAFNCPDNITDALKTAGFDMLLTANNHCYDTRTVGLTRTLQVAAKRGLATLGTQAESSDKDYVVQDLNGIKVGMICYTYATNDKDPERPSMNGIMVKADYADRINYFETDKLDQFYNQMSDQIDAMKAEGAEAIVLYIHWGQEYQTKANSTQKTMAQKLCDLGVDVIVGGHPHVIQPIQLLTSTEDENHKTVCLYSLGNAISNQRKDLMTLDTGHTEDGMLFSFTLAKYTDGEVMVDSIDVLPTWVYMKKASTNTYKIVPLDKSVADWSDAFKLSESATKNAKKSYDRTMAIVGDGLTASNEFLTARRETKLEDGREPALPAEPVADAAA